MTHTRTLEVMKYAPLVAILFVIGCGGGANNPVAPSPLPVVGVPPPTAPTPPPVATPPPTPAPPTPAFPPSDPRFDMTFYRQFVHNAYDTRGGLEPLRRQNQAPRIYLRTVDDSGTPIDASTLEQTAVALENTAGSLTGVFGLAGLERGTGDRLGQPGWITVYWSSEPKRVGTLNICGEGFVGGNRLILYPRSLGCRCSGGPAVSLATVKHELGHVLGFWHTPDRRDLMHGLLTACDHDPSEREKFHAALAYSRPVGSPAP